MEVKLKKKETIFNISEQTIRNTKVQNIIYFLLKHTNNNSIITNKKGGFQIWGLRRVMLRSYPLNVT